MMHMKICTGCKQSLSMDNFPLRSAMSSRRRSRCVACKRADDKASHAAFRARVPAKPPVWPHMTRIAAQSEDHACNVALDGFKRVVNRGPLRWSVAA